MKPKNPQNPCKNDGISYPLNASEPAVLDFSGETLVLNKPGGLLTQAPPGIPSVESWARQLFRQSNPESFYVGIAHRLDRPASGVLLIGQNKQVTRKLASQFENRTIKKTYWALVSSNQTLEKGQAGTWTDWMRKIPNKPKSEICEPSSQDAKEAILDFKVLATNKEFGLIEIQLQTGRTHQIRLQTSSRGFPILGDHQYGSPFPFGPETDDERKKWIALHAREIEFWHPRHHQPTTFTAAVPEYWKPIFEKLNFAEPSNP